MKKGGDVKKGMIVKYSNPQKGEELLRFLVKEVNGDRVIVELICDDILKPTFCHNIKEYTESYLSKQVLYNGKMIESIYFGEL